MIATNTRSGERADLLEALGKHRFFLRHTTRGLTEAQAAASPSASALCLGGLIKHVAQVEERWVRFILDGPDAMPSARQWTEADDAAWRAGFQMRPGETLAGALEDYQRVASATDELVATVDLDPNRCPRRPGSSRAPAGRPGGCCCTSSPRPHSTPDTRTSFGRPSTARRAWVDRDREGRDRSWRARGPAVAARPAPVRRNRLSADEFGPAGRSVPP